ncbi:MAG: PEP-CTERM sorting domain-containing protein [Pseudomonadota bacterium]|jgi:hypothetical protein
MATKSCCNRLSRTLHAALAKIVGTATLLVAISGTASAAIVLNPLVGGTFLNGNGANSQWVQVPNDWRGTIYGQNPDFNAWNTGIWGLEDAMLALDPPNTDVVARYQGLSGPIAFADQRYVDEWAPTWGTQPLAPVLDPAPGAHQDNWAVRFTGYIAITDPGLYNFGVLYDDGFSFSLFGADGALSLLMDGLNPRDRLGFESDLDLLPGLYGFQLTSWERLEAGVVSLDWVRPGGEWELIPRNHLFNAVPVPAPAAVALLLPGLALLTLRLRARRA